MFHLRSREIEGRPNRSVIDGVVESVAGVPRRVPVRDNAYLGRLRDFGRLERGRSDFEIEGCPNHSVLG